MSQSSDGPAAIRAEQLGQLNRLATSARLVAGLAHELNNSLQVVRGLVDLLADHPDVPPDAAARITRIGGQADKATSAIRQVMDYARDGVDEPPRADAASAVERAIALRHYNLGRAGIAVTTELPAELAARIDDRSLVQIVLNLVLNAEDALASQPRRELHLGGALVGRGVRLTVRDTGHGVASEIRERIFEPFFTTRTDARAVGLGLSAARALATRYGGSLVLFDGTQGTTTFVVELPAV